MSGRDAFGTQFIRNIATPETVGNVSNLSGPNRERTSIEVTAHDSANKYREFVKGLKDGGEVVLTINYDPTLTSMTGLEDDYEDEALNPYQVVILPGTADEHTWDFSGLITNIGDEFPVDGRMEREVTIKVSGQPALTATGGA